MSAAPLMVILGWENAAIYHSQYKGRLGNGFRLAERLRRIIIKNRCP